MQRRKGRLPQRRKTRTNRSSPPQFSSTFTTTKRVRFQASAALTDVTINPSDILDLLCMAVTTTSAYRIVQAIRATRVEMWGPMSATLAPVTVSCEFTSDASELAGPSKIFSDTSMGSAQAAHIACSPPKDSVQSMWQQGTPGYNIWCVLNGPINTVIDIWLTMTMVDSSVVAPIAVAGTVVAATVGQVYVRALDSSSSGILVPVSYDTI